MRPIYGKQQGRILIVIVSCVTDITHRVQTECLYPIEGAISKQHTSGYSVQVYSCLSIYFVSLDKASNPSLNNNPGADG